MTRTVNDIYGALGVKRIINAKGPATRLSGGIMRPEVAAAMTAASQHCVDMAELQAAASRAIARVTGAEAGYVASGAAACLLLAACACMTGLDPGAMARLPGTRGLKNQIIMVRSQRNFYDHAVRASGAEIVEVGLPDRYAGAGVRDAELWEIADAITDRTAAIFYVAGMEAQPPLPAVARLACERRVPVIVDAAAQLPPQSNLKRFVAEGADLVAFSGGKAIGGPQASGMLCGKRDLIMAAALQNLDLDVHDDLWYPPRGLIDRKRLKGIPPHGLGRTCKAGKEEIAGLLTALEIFVAEGDAARHGRWLGLIKQLHSLLCDSNSAATITGAEDTATVPCLVLQLAVAKDAGNVALALQRLARPIYVDAALRQHNRLVLNPMCLAESDVPLLAKALRKEIG